MKKPASLVAAILFWLIALAQLVLVLLRVEVTAGGVNTALGQRRGFLILAALEIWLWWEHRDLNEPSSARRR